MLSLGSNPSGQNLAWAYPRLSFRKLSAILTFGGHILDLTHTNRCLLQIKQALCFWHNFSGDKTSIWYYFKLFTFVFMSFSEGWNASISEMAKYHSLTELPSPYYIVHCNESPLTKQIHYWFCFSRNWFNATSFFNLNCILQMLNFSYNPCFLGSLISSFCWN